MTRVEATREVQTGARVVPHRVLAGCAFAAVAVATLAPVWNAPGWPMSHEGVAFAQRTYVYAKHLARFDLFPLWAGLDASGFGSPMPLFYHRLFYLLAAPLALLLRSYKAGDALAVVITLIGGAVGMYRLVRQLGASRLAATAAGCSLIAANYTVTNWLVRGAVAELTGAMIVPWVLWFFIRAIGERRISIGLGVALGLLWHSHSVIAFYSGMLLAVTFVILAVVRQASWSTIDPRTAWPALAVFAVLLVPHLLLMSSMRGEFDLSRFLSPPLHPSYQFRPLSWYFWDRHWHFGHTESGLTLQIDLAMLVLLGVSARALILRRRDSSPSSWQRVMPLCIVLGLSLVLQMHWTEPFYLHVPGAAYIQFPWRLLALITPALIATAMTLADGILPQDVRLVALSASTAWMIAGSGAFVPIVDQRTTLDPVPLERMTFSGFREYEPVAAPPIPQLEAALQARWQQAGCSVTRESPFDEVAVVSFEVSCDRAGVVPLPIYGTPLHEVSVSTFDRGSGCQEVPDIPAVCGATVPGGQSRVSVRYPTVGTTVAHAVRGMSRRR